MEKILKICFGLLQVKIINYTCINQNLTKANLQIISEVHKHYGFAKKQLIIGIFGEENMQLINKMC